MSTDSAYDLSTMRRAAGGLPERPDTNVLGLASLVWRHRWLLVVVTAVGAAVGVLSGQLVETKYTASAPGLSHLRWALAARAEAVFSGWHRWPGGAMPWTSLPRSLASWKTRVPATPGVTCSWRSS